MFLILFLNFQIGAIYVDPYERETIRKNNVPAMATIISYTSTGTVFLNKPELRIELEVQPPYEQQFVTTTEHFVAYHDLVKVEPGTRVRLWYLEGTTRVAFADL